MDSRRGIPQGSAVSPLVASFVMAKLLDDLEQDLNSGTHLVSYVDNVGIYGTEPLAVIQAMSALKRVCARCRFGTLGLNDKYRLVNADICFNFLGYEIRREVFDGAPRAIISVSAKNIKKFQKEVRRRLRDGQVSNHVHDFRQRREDTAASVREFISSWCSSFAIVPNINLLAVEWAFAASEHLPHQRHILRKSLSEHC